ncbi:hypothetical protein M1589_00670 [Candidatus Marsarchaeota archaeon]|jgi:hypothetical protein|nr:hypothetical protein [Candidatus Marsarchaeota archaeon]MCL5115390.1 hypothetical protein [Candidatus Marsarchaeota archaeon]
MGRTVDFKFNESGHELEAGRKTAGRPYYMVTQNSPAGDNYFTTMETLSKIVIAIPNNSIRVNGVLSISINERHLYSGRIEAIEAKRTESFDVRPEMVPRNHLSVVIECEQVNGSEPYIVQLQLS